MTILKKYSYVAVSFLAGFSLMTFELIAARLVAPLVGSSVFTWTSVIGTVLLGLSFGSIAGGMLADYYKNDKVLGYVLLLSAFSVFMTPILARSADFTRVPLGMWATTLVVSLALFLIPSFFLGMLQPIALKLYARSFFDIGKEYGFLSVVWSLGSIAGVFLTGFYFTAAIGTAATLTNVGFLLFLLAVYFLVCEKRYRVGRFIFAIVGTALFLVALSFVTRSHASSNVVYEKETPYYLARVVNIDNMDIGPAKALFLDFDSHSVEKTSEASGPLFYTAMAPVFGVIKNDIKKIHVIGGGAYTLPKRFVDYYPNADVSVTEIDPEVTRIAEEYFNLDAYNIKSFHEDARLYFARSRETYDVVFGDAYNSFISVPWHLATREFTREIRDHLNPGGIYAINFISSLDPEKSDFFISMLKTFSREFPHHYVFVFGDTPSRIQNVVLVGTNGSLPETSDNFYHTLKNNSGTKQFAAFLFDEKSIDISSGIALTDDFAPVEKLMSSTMADYFPRYVAFYSSLVK